MTSIIVPIYNRELTLPSCLESISRLMMRDFEVILVDDGSTDGSASICKTYIENDDRFTYIYQENGGVSQARNKGIEMAKGDYVTFVDSDDFVCPGHLSVDYDKRYSFYIKGVKFCDIQHSGMPIPNELDRTKGIVKKELIRKHDIVDFIFSDYPEMNNTVYHVTNKIYRKDIIQKHHIRFKKDVSVGEDMIFNCDFLKHVTSLSITNAQSYIICYYGLSRGG